MSYENLYDAATAAVISGLISNLQRNLFAGLQSVSARKTFTQEVSSSMAGVGRVENVMVTDTHVTVVCLIDGIKHSTVLTVSDVLKYLPSISRSKSMPMGGIRGSRLE